MIVDSYVVFGICAGCCAKVAKFEILDANGHQIISSLAEPALASHCRTIGDSVRFTDASGNVVLTMAEVGDVS